MKIFFPLDGTPGCRVVVGQGFLDGFNDDHPGSNLTDLTGATFSFDGNYQLSNIQVKNGDLKKLAGPHMGKLIAIVRDWAQDQRPPKQSGFRQALKVPWVVEPSNPVEKPEPQSSESEPLRAEEPSAPAVPWYEKDDSKYNYRKVPGQAVLVRRRKAS